MTTTRKPRSSNPCSREGCQGKAFEDNKYCCFICRATAQELENTERICKALGNTELSNALWAEAVEMNDTVSRYLRLGYLNRMAAVESGMSEREYFAIRRGRVAASRTDRQSATTTSRSSRRSDR